MKNGSEIWMGNEIEHSVVFESNGGAGTCPPEVAARAVMGMIRQKLPHIPFKGGGVILANGSRIYLDGGRHLEQATAEVESPDQLVRLRHETERVLVAATRLAARDAGFENGVISYISWDYQAGVAFGNHGNYSTKAPRNEDILPFLVSRPLITGAGALDPTSAGISFTISPRAFFSNCAESRHTEGDGRGIIDTLNLNRARPSGRCPRYHLHVAEGSRSDTNLRLRYGVTAAVLASLEAGGTLPLDQIAIDEDEAVSAFRRISSDPSCRAVVPTQGGWMTGCEIQRAYLGMVRENEQSLPDWVPAIVELWDDTLSKLEEDPGLLSRTLDWRIKLSIFDKLVGGSSFGSWGELAPLSTLARILERKLRREHGPGFKLGSASLAAIPEARLLESVSDESPEARDLIDRLPEFFALRDRMAVADLKYMQAGEESLFMVMARAGLIDREAAGLDLIDEMEGREPFNLSLAPAGRARTRGQLVELFGRDSGRDDCEMAWHWFRGPGEVAVDMPYVSKEVKIPSSTRRSFGMQVLLGSETME